MTNLHSELHQFCGSEQWTRTNPFAPNVICSEGVVYLAEKAGAYWLIDAICSHLTHSAEIKKLGEPFRAFHLWKLKKNEDGGATLTAVEDTGCKPVVSQEIPYTDFPFPADGEFTLYVGNDGSNTYNKIFLPSEY